MGWEKFPGESSENTLIKRQPQPQFWDIENIYFSKLELGESIVRARSNTGLDTVVSSWFEPFPSVG